MEYRVEFVFYLKIHHKLTQEFPGNTFPNLYVKVVDIVKCELSFHSSGKWT